MNNKKLIRIICAILAGVMLVGLLPLALLAG